MHSSRAGNGEQEDVRQFILRFQERYCGGDIRPPPFAETSLSEAMTRGKREGKLVLIYLHSQDHQVL